MSHKRKKLNTHAASIVEENINGRVLVELRNAAQEINPAVRLAFELNNKALAGLLTEDELLGRQKEIEEAIVAGEQEAERINKLQSRIREAKPDPSSYAPNHF